MAKNPIPATKAKWGTFYVLREKAAKDLYGIVKDAVAGTLMLGGGGVKGGAAVVRAVGDVESQQLRDFFRSGMDMKTRNALGISPIAPWLARAGAAFVLYPQPFGRVRHNVLWMAP